MKGPRVRLFLRLTTHVNDRLRMLMRYHGELSRYIDDALTSLDLANIELMPVTAGKSSRAITAIVSGSTNARIRAAAKQRGCTVTALADSALVWTNGWEEGVPDKNHLTGRIRLVGLISSVAMHEFLQTVEAEVQSRPTPIE